MNKINPAYKIIADHLRSAVFLIADGILPSNEGRGYVLRRIMRRAMLNIHQLQIKQPFMYKLVPFLIEKMKDAYPEIKNAQKLIENTLKNEEETFSSTLKKGLEILNQELEKDLYKKKKIFSGKIAFKLYDTFGFPLDLTENILKEKNMTVNLEEFKQEMENQRQRARANWAGGGEQKEDNLYFDLEKKFGSTEFVGYANTKNKAKIISLIQDGKEVKKIDKNSKNIALIIDKTSFYPTSGGQKGDDGNIILASEFNENGLINYHEVNNIIDIYETRKFAKNLYTHQISEIKGEFKVGDEIFALVNNRNRQFRAQNHSATHLLHYVLRKVLGDHVTQKGSNVENTHFTFDFSHHKALSQEEIYQIEDLVNFYIRHNSEVKTEILAIDEARKKGAISLFGEKYDDIVRVLSMAADNSVEFCGGTHVNFTGNIAIFKIISEKSIASGIRRIEAKTGYFALQHFRLQENKLNALLDSLKIKQQFEEIKLPKEQFFNSKSSFDDLSFFVDEFSENEVTSKCEILELERISAKIAKIGDELSNLIKQKDKELEKLKKDNLLNNIGNFKSEKINQINFIYHIFDDLSAKDLREFVLTIKSKKEYRENSIILFFSNFEDKISALLCVSKDLQEKIPANQFISEIIEKIGGKKGGGSADLAMGGGSDKKGLQNAVNFLRELIKTTVN